ncbi:hypothetical protein N7470_000348 [Penicillium chermesinum]|nr:hypothetical protein N7470_000348 [Penicillium chermesinum]
MADNSSPDYKSLFLQAEEGRKQAEERRKQAEDEGRLLRERSRRTTFAEFIHTCHNLLSRPLRVESPSRSTTGTIPLPKGKFCPTRLRPWTECHAQQQTVYNSSPSTLEDLARRFARRPISSEQGLETYERIAVEDHVRDIVDELFEYKPPHKLSVENLRAGLQPMDVWEELVQKSYIPTDPAEKLQYNAEVLANSAVVQSYDVMIQEGRAYSILTNGLARVLLYVPHDDPTTLYYRLCEPNTEIDEFGQHLRQPQTSIARELCLCLMSFLSPTRDQAWRNFWRSKLHIWETSFDHSHSLIPKAELRQTPPQSRNHNLEYTTPESSSDYQPSSSSIESPTAEGRRVRTRSQAGCTPSSDQRRSQSPDSSGSDSNKATGRKRGFSQVTSSPSAQRAARQRETRFTKATGPKGAMCNFAPSDGQDGSRHPINAESLVLLLKEQLDEDIDQCTPFGSCGAYGAPFKITSTTHGYTVVGKGTTSELWKEVSREAQVYQVLGKAQGSAVPVFLGTIDLAQIYFLHGAGQIRHMLIMGWGGESTATMELTPSLLQEIRRSDKEIEGLGVIHGDLRRENVLWNEELGRALIIDFHRSTLKRLLISKRPRAAKRELRGIESRDGKRLRVG